MAVFRFLASLFLLIAIVAFVSDMTPTSASDPAPTITSLHTHINQLAPATLESVKAWTSETLGAGVSINIVQPLLAVPTSVGFGVMALLCGYLGRRRLRPNVFIN